MKSKATLVLLAALTALSAGCAPVQQTGETPPAQQQEQPDAAYFGLAYYAGEPVSPVRSSSRINRILCEGLYEGLFELDETFTPRPVLCESMETAGNVWTFTLRSGVSFWSGAPLIAADVAASYQNAKNDPNSPYYTRFANVAAIEALDDTRLRLTLSSPNAGLPALLDVPVCKAGTEADAFAEGTGPYRPVQEQGAWVLLPNEHWHGGAADAFERIPLVTTVRADAVVYSFETGDVSMTRAERISPETSVASGSMNVYQTPSTDFHYLGVRHADPILEQAGVRQALSALIERESLCKTPLQGYADGAVLPVNPQPDGVSLEADGEKARLLLTGAGLTDLNGDGALEYQQGAAAMPFAPVILVNADNPFKVAAAQNIAAAWNTAGIRAAVSALPYDEYLAALQAGRFDLYYGETLLTPDFDLQALVAPAGGLNFGKYAGESLSQALYTARATGETDGFYAAFAAEAPVIPLAFERNQVVLRTGLLENFAPPPANLFAGAENWEAYQ